MRDTVVWRIGCANAIPLYFFPYKYITDIELYSIDRVDRGANLGVLRELFFPIDWKRCAIIWSRLEWQAA